jgi:hypothetical protein
MPKEDTLFKHITTISALLLYLLFHAFTAGAADQKILENITFESTSASEERITFKLNKPNIPKIFAMKGERPRVVFDFPDTKMSRILKNTINTNGKFIQRIRIGLHKAPNPKTRVVFDLMPDQEVDFKNDFDSADNSLIITVYHAGTLPAETEITQQEEKIEQKPAEPPARETKVEAAPEITAEPAEVPVTAAAEEVAVVKETVVEQEPVVSGQTTAEELPAVSPVQAPDAESATTVTKAPEITEPKQEKTPKPQPAVEKSIEKTAGKIWTKQPAPEASPVEQPAVSPAETAAPTVPAVEEHVKAPEPPAVAGNVAPVLQSVTFDNSKNRGEMVLFKLNSFHPPIVFGVEEGNPRVVCDFKETAAADDLPASIEAKGKYVRSIRIGKETTPKKVRVVLDLVKNSNYDLQQVFFKDDNLFVLIINALGTTTTPEEIKQSLQ